MDDIIDYDIFLRIRMKIIFLEFIFFVFVNVIFINFFIIRILLLLNNLFFSVFEILNIIK